METKKEDSYINVSPEDIKEISKFAAYFIAYYSVCKIATKGTPGKVQVIGIKEIIEEWEAENGIDISQCDSVIKSLKDYLIERAKENSLLILEFALIKEK